jgi:hypothetical protein
MHEKQGGELVPVGNGTAAVGGKEWIKTNHDLDRLVERSVALNTCIDPLGSL